MNKNDLISQVADDAGLSKADATKAVDAVFDSISGVLSKGEARLVGFGTFSVAHRKATTGRNPRTGEAIQIAASKQPKFKAGKGLKGAVNKHRLNAVIMGAGLRFILGQRLFFCFFPADALNAIARAVSSAGRASRLHREGRRFDPVTAHHLSLHHIFRCGGNLDLTAIRVARKSKATWSQVLWGCSSVG